MLGNSFNINWLLNEFLKRWAQMKKKKRRLLLPENLRNRRKLLCMAVLIEAGDETGQDDRTRGADRRGGGIIHRPQS
jgi:hypothetical protein